jgi:thiaminase
MFNFDKVLDQRLEDHQREQDLQEEYQEWIDNYISDRGDLFKSEIEEIEDLFWDDPEMFIKEANYEI